MQVTKNPNRGIELGYASKATDSTTASATPADVTGLATTVTVGTRPVNIRFSVGLATMDAATGAGVVDILRGSTLINRAYWAPKSTGGAGAFSFEIRDAPAAGSYTYKIQISRVTTGTFTLSGSGASTVQALQVLEC